MYAYVCVCMCMYVYVCVSYVRMYAKYIRMYAKTNKCIYREVTCIYYFLLFSLLLFDRVGCVFSFKGRELVFFVFPRHMKAPPLSRCVSDENCRQGNLGSAAFNILSVVECYVCMYAYAWVCTAACMYVHVCIGVNLCGCTSLYVGLKYV